MKIKTKISLDTRRVKDVLDIYTNDSIPDPRPDPTFHAVKDIEVITSITRGVILILNLKFLIFS